MLAKALIYLCLAPLSAVIAAYPGRSALSSAVELPVDDGIHYALPRGQYPVYDDGPDQHHLPKEVDGTIYKFLSNCPKFTLITKALNFEEKIATILNDPSAKLTFFAPPDEVLRRKHRRHDIQWSALRDAMTGNPLSILEHADFGSVLELMENVDHPDAPGDPEKRKKIIKFILHIILSYHIIDDVYDIEKLGAHNTLPTHLMFHHHNFFDKQPIRLRVTKKLIPPFTWINLFTRIIFGNIHATNGFVHAMSHPLIPPPSVFQELYMVPEHFSTLTSALQRSNLTELLDFRHVHHDAHETSLKHSNLVTVFAPTNHAFQRLPKKLRLFLFSPFGERVLQKLLRYHIVPEVAFFSDYVHHAKVPDFFDLEFSSEGNEIPARRWFSILDWPRRRKSPIIEPISREKYILETALSDRTLDVIVDKKRVTLPLPHKPSAIKTSIIVNHQLAYIRDIVGLNGAIHVIDRLLDPRKHCQHPPEHKDHEDDQAWEDWEEWLPQWANEN